MPQYAQHRIYHSLPGKGRDVGERGASAAAEVKVDNAASAEFFALSSRSAAAAVVVAAADVGGGAAAAAVVRVAASKSKRWQYT